MLKKFTAIAIIAIIAASFAACNTNNGSSSQITQSSQTVTAAAEETTAAKAVDTAKSADSEVITTLAVTSNGKLDTGDMFTDRDLTQEADLTGAEKITLSDGQNVSITKAGVYILSGSAKNVTVTVEAADDDKVQLVLDGVTVTNTDSPCIYVKNADKVFVTTAGDNSLSVTGSFTADGETNTDDDLKITGGTINIECASDGLEANDSVAIADGSITINSQKDGIHVENNDDNAKGYFYICGGTLNITAADDGIHATTVAQIDNGTITSNAAEGLEATYIQINGGTLNISASDDGINAANKSKSYEVAVEINDGTITIKMGAGDTDGIDSNGNLYIRGGTIDITGQSPFDYDGQLEHTGGKLIVNGTETDEVTNQMMGGGMRGNRGGMPGGDMGGNMNGAPQMR